MQAFVQRSAPRTGRGRAGRDQQPGLAEARAQTLQPRAQEDAAWEAACRERRTGLRPAQWSPQQGAISQAAADRWLLVREQHQAALARRQGDEARWAAAQARLQAPLTPAAAKPPWIAILVVTDNL
jgi:hypothetical protein